MSDPCTGGKTATDPAVRGAPLAESLQAVQDLGELDGPLARYRHGVQGRAASLRRMNGNGTGGRGGGAGRVPNGAADRPASCASISTTTEAGAQIEMLLVFKAARRQEYLQENLRVLGALRGETVETAYGRRWQSAAVRQRPPEPGEEALVVFTSRPYRRFTPARFGRVVEGSIGEEGQLRLVLELGSRAHVADHDRWQRWVSAGPNPSEASEVWVCRDDERDPAAEPAPVEYADAAHDERAWRRTIERLVHDDDYARAVFLRVGSVRPADETAGPPLDPPYHLTADRAYSVCLVSYNPHLDDDFRSDARFVPFHDELSTAVVLDDPKELPADGTVELMLEPIVAGPGWLDLHVSRGADLLLAARLGWTAGPAPAAAERPPAVERPPAAPPEREPVAATGAIEMTAAAPPDLRLSDAALRAYRLVRDGSADVRLALLDELLELVPRDTRLRERRGVVLHELGRHEEALRELETIALDTLGRDGRAACVAARLRLGRLPDPIERIRVADLTDDATFTQVLEASAGLPPEAQLRLTEFAVERLLSDDRAGRWLEALVERPFPRDALRRLVELWQYVDPLRATLVLERLLEAERLGLEDERVARLLHELARGAGRNGAVRGAVDALAESAERRGDAAALAELLGRVRTDLRRDEAHLLGERLVRAIADATPDEEPIDEALLAAADFIEDHRQAGELDRATALAVVASANLRRASETTSARLGAVLAALDEALGASETYRKYAEMREREANLDLREKIASLRFLFVGGKRPEWYDALRTELALSERCEWVESEKKKAPSMDMLEERLKRGRWAGVVLFTDRIGHKTSGPLIRLCRELDVKLLEPRRLTRDALIAALREHFVG